MPLLPLEETLTRRSRGSSSPSLLTPQLSAAQRAAQAAQARADGSAWSLTKELAMLGESVCMQCRLLLTSSLSQHWKHANGGSSHLQGRDCLHGGGHVANMSLPPEQEFQTMKRATGVWQWHCIAVSCLLCLLRQSPGLGG